MASNGTQQTTDWIQFGLDPAVASALQQLSPSSLQHEILNQALVRKNRSIIVTSPCNPPEEHDRANTAIDTVVLQHATTGREVIRNDARTAKQAIAQHGEVHVVRDPAKGVFPSALIVCPTEALVAATHKRLSALSAAGGLDLVISAKSGRYVKPTAEIAVGGFEVQHFACADIMIGTTTYLGRLIQDTHPTKKDEEDLQSLHLSGTTLTVWMDGKRLSEVDGGLLINSKRVPETDREQHLQSLKRAIAKRESDSAHIVVTTSLNEDEHIGWGNEILRHGSPVTSMIQGNTARRDHYVPEKPVSADKEKQYHTQVWEWAIPLGKAMRHAQTMDTEQPFIVLIANNSPKITSLPGAVIPPGSQSDNNRAAGVIIYGLRRILDADDRLKARLTKSGQDVDVLWPHWPKHHRDIRAVIKILDEAGEPVPPFMHAIRESQVQVQCDKATGPVSVGPQDASEHNIGGRDDSDGDGDDDDDDKPSHSSSKETAGGSENILPLPEDLTDKAPEPQEEGTMDGQATSLEEHAEDAPGEIPQPQHPSGESAPPAEHEPSDGKTASENQESSSKETPAGAPNSTIAVPGPVMSALQGTTPAFKPSTGPANGTMPSPGATPNSLPKNIAAMAPNPSNTDNPVVPAPTNGNVRSSSKDQGKPAASVNGVGGVTEQKGAIGGNDGAAKGVGKKP